MLSTRCEPVGTRFLWL